MFPEARSLKLLILSLLAALVVLPACSGPGDVAGGSGVGNGEVAVLMTDGPSDDFEAIELTVLRIELFGSRGKVTVFEGREVFDLLRLRNVSELFAIHGNVPADVYSKIRLTLEDIRLVERDGDGQVVSYHPHIPGNGKLDLNPREPFQVRPDELLLLQIDMDAEKSIHIVGTGSGKYNFRPVVFVDVIHAFFENRLVRLHGRVRDIDRETGSFTLCSLCSDSLDYDREDAPSATPLSQGASIALPAHADVDDGGDFGRTRCTRVETLDRTSFFDEMVEPVDLDALAEGDTVSVLGRLRSEGRELHLIAEVVLIGPRGTFANLLGTALSEVDEDDRFSFEIGPRQGFLPGSSIAVQLQDASRLLSRQGAELDRSDIQPGSAAEVIGVIATDDLEIRAAVVLLRPSLPDAETLHGTLDAIDAVQRRVDLDLESGEGTVCVQVPLLSPVLLVSGGESTRVGLGDLQTGLQADAHGRYLMMGGCFIADSLVVFAEEPGV